jgi:anti-anti-sigma regulatory factor
MLHITFQALVRGEYQRMDSLKPFDVLGIEFTPGRDVSKLVLKGEFDPISDSQITWFVAPLEIISGALEIDLTGVTYMDARAMRELQRWIAKLSAKVWLRVSGVTLRLAQSFQLQRVCVLVPVS